MNKYQTVNSAGFVLRKSDKMAYTINQRLGYVSGNLILLILLSGIFGNVGIVGIGLIGVLISLICAEGLPHKYYSYMFITISIMMIYLLVHYYGLIEEYGKPYYAGDDEHFEYWCDYLYSHGVFTFNGLKKVVFWNQWNARGYPLLLVWIKLLCLGHYHTAMPRILNLYFWLSISLVAVKMLRMKVDNPKVEKVMFMSLALFPNGIYMASFVYRDVLMEFLIVLIIYNFIRCLEQGNRSEVAIKKFFRIVIIAFGLFYLSYLRYVAIYLCILMAGLAILERYQDMRKGIKTMLFLVIGLVGIIFLVRMDFFNMLTRYSQNSTNYLLSQGYGLSSKIFSTPILPFGWTLRAVYGLVVPFPGGLLSQDYFGKPFYALSKALTYMGTFYQLFMVPYLIRSILKKSMHAWMFLIVYASVVFTTFTFRHFIFPLPFFAMSVAEGYVGTSRKKHLNYFGIIILAIIGMVGLYAVLKIIY